MKSIKNAVYLDVCALCRPYDDQRYMRIAGETTAMKTAKFLDDKKVIERGVMALHKELGPIEASRFIAITGVKHQDSVGGHRKWQESLNPDLFIKDVLNEYKK